MTTQVCRKHWVGLPADMTVVSEENGGSIGGRPRPICLTAAKGGHDSDPRHGA